MPWPPSGCRPLTLGSEAGSGVAGAPAGNDPSLLVPSAGGASSVSVEGTVQEAAVLTSAGPPWQRPEKSCPRRQRGTPHPGAGGSPGSALGRAALPAGSPRPEALCKCARAQGPGPPDTLLLGPYLGLVPTGARASGAGREERRARREPGPARSAGAPRGSGRPRSALGFRLRQEREWVRLALPLPPPARLPFRRGSARVRGSTSHQRCPSASSKPLRPATR